jgi:hypothetical protein
MNKTKIQYESEIKRLNNLYGYDDKETNKKIAMLKYYIDNIKLIDEE